MRFELGTHPPTVSGAKWFLTTEDDAPASQLCATCSERIPPGDLFVETLWPTSPYHIVCIRFFPGWYRWFIDRLDDIKAQCPDIYARVVLELAT